ncbi:PIG-L family deacetylase [Glutamicibacter sp. NPDC087344]|uniref:PIG-L family deacetylase n=1 Tax=Glutamicibacter sp. NPDC087344 TaxID=3363994 RepID=UPI00381BD878
MVTFSHLQQGTTAQTWRDCGIEALEPLPLDRVFESAHRLVVLAAHPDDETLGAGGLVHEALRRNIAVEIVLCTDGESSHPNSRTCSAEQLAEVRASEVAQAVQRLQRHRESSTGITVTRLGLPDGRLAEHRAELRVALLERARGSRCVLASTYRADAHADHEVLGLIAADVAQQLLLFHLEFPIWYWHWASPLTDGRWRHWNRLELDAAAFDAKREALSAHRSQIQPLSDQPGDEALLGPEIMEHFLQPGEIFRLSRPGEKDTAMSAAVFEDLYRDKPDPWNYRDSGYEARKRGILLSSLIREHYGTVLELGCSIGIQTSALAERCSSLRAIDSSRTALEQAQRETARFEHVQLEQRLLPGEWPQVDPGTMDLVVISEIGYFFAADELEEMLGLCASALAPGGELLLCHWLHPIEGWPLNGQAVHRIAHRRRWDRLVIHQERDFLLEILRKPGALHE